MIFTFTNDYTEYMRKGRVSRSLYPWSQRELGFYEYRFSFTIPYLRRSNWTFAYLDTVITYP